MNAALLAPDAAPALSELQQFLDDSASPLSAAQAVALALGAWISAQRQQPAGMPHASLRGYQWKCLFLPDGTDVRMEYAGQDFHARVAGNAIVYEGRQLSPRQLTLAIAGEGRNAWRDLWIRFPGERCWTRAALLRRRHEQQAGGQPASPLDAMREAAACMSETLKNALALVEHANRQALPGFERRLERPRRAQDVLGATCVFD
jgi:hypothetical protein